MIPKRCNKLQTHLKSQNIEIDRDISYSKSKYFKYLLIL